MICHVLTLIFLVIYCNASQPHLGCYKENKDDRDLPEEVWTNRTTSDELNITECMITCQSRGFPYAGLGRGAQECFCGSTFGKHGQSDECLYVCLGFPEYKCGGSIEYNIYYTVQQEQVCPSNTLLVERQPYDVCLSPVESKSKTFDQARTHCLQQNQEIVTLDSKTMVDIVEELMTNASKGDASVWLGLSRSAVTDEFGWTSKHEIYSKSVISEFWESGHPKNDLCSFYNSLSGKFESGSCSDSLLFICQSTLDKTSIVIYKSLGDKIADFFANDGNVAMVCVVMLIVLVVAGCSVIYCFHKKAKERQRQSKISGRSRNFKPFAKSKIHPNNNSNKLS